MDNEVGLGHSKFAQIIQKMKDNCTGADVVTDKNVFQEGNPTNKPLLKQIVRDLIMPGSQILGFEHLVELLRTAQKKKPCLILMEHYSNFDIPCLYELLEERGADGREVADSIVSVAGVKLNEESKLVRAFTEIFTRVVLFPARSVQAASDPKERREAEHRRAKINVAALKALNTLRRQGRLILVFPTGTRYRPWDPSTGKGLKEIDTYLKFYSHMVTIAINGNTLLPNPNGRMDEDYPRRDVMVYTVSPVLKCSEFRREAVRGRAPEEDLKQHVVDAVMARLAALHRETEKMRLGLLPANGRA
jgi:glycerol-3-phosphate O-acyltransferase